MNGKWPNAPIFYAASQIIFNPIQDMGQYVDAIQARMRGLKYPDFRTDIRRGLQVNAAGAELDLQQQQLTRWHFTNFDKTDGFILLPNALFFQTTAYETSEELRRALLQGIEIVNEVVGLDYIESISVRTLDAVIPCPGGDLRDYIKSNFLGFWDSNGLNLQRAVMDSILQKNGISTIARVVLLGSDNTGLGIPFDLFPISLKLAEKFERVADAHVILDNDSRLQSRFKFDLEEISTGLGAVKEEVTSFFYSVVTDWAVRSWKGEL